MDKVTYDMLDDFGEVTKNMFRLLYPAGLEMDRLKEKAKQFGWHREIYERMKGD